MKFREIKVPEEALKRMHDEVAAGNLVSGTWPAVVEVRMRDIAKTENAVAVSSGTMALKIALDAMGVGNGDFVIVPDLTFIACASVVQELGAIPLFVDVDDRFVIDYESTLEVMVRMEGRIKAIMAVRLGGEEVPDWVFKLGVPVLVDSAHSMEYSDPRATATCYSFYPTKIVSGIEGGVLATNNAQIASKARELRLFGFREGTRIAHQLGYKGNMSNVSASLIAFNLGHLEGNLSMRAMARDIYNGELGLHRSGVGMYMVTVDDPDAVCAQIPAIRHYPVTLAEMITGASFSKHARWATRHLISLPFDEHIVDKDILQVCAIVKPRLIIYEDQHGTQRSGAV